MTDTKLLNLLNTCCDAVVGSRSADLVPSVCWGMGFHMHADGQHATVWLARAQAGQLLADVAATGQLAVSLCQPITNISIQLKGHDAQVRDALPADDPLLQRHLANMAHEIGLVGFGVPFVHAAFHRPLEALVAVDFTIDTQFIQTPGPGAGQPMATAG